MASAPATLAGTGTKSPRAASAIVSVRHAVAQLPVAVAYLRQV